MSLDPKLRSPKEKPLFVIGVIFSTICWLALIISLVGLIYGFFILVFLLIAHALFLAHVKGNGLRVSERQLPDLYARCKAAAEKLGMPQVPEIYVLQHGGMLNAFATKLLSRKFVIILSDLVDNCSDPRQLEFVIGHELGHFAAGHLAWNAYLAPFRLVPWLGAAYSRAREYTCDRCGLHAVGELEPSLRGLVVLAAGGKLAAQADLDAFAEQRIESGGFWMAVGELVSSHPYLCKRVAALQEVAAPGTVREVGRNPLAYVFAPFFGVATGAGASVAVVMVMWIGIAAAIAIPNFIKYQERSRLNAVNSFGAPGAFGGYGAGSDADAIADQFRAFDDDPAFQQQDFGALQELTPEQLEALRQAFGDPDSYEKDTDEWVPDEEGAPANANLDEEIEE